MIGDHLATIWWIPQKVGEWLMEVSGTHMCEIGCREVCGAALKRPPRALCFWLLAGCKLATWKTPTCLQTLANLLAGRGEL